MIDLDHVAIALQDVGDTLRVLVSELGARVLPGGGNAIGFRAMQVDAGDMKVELLEPHNVEINDFIVRFLERNGDGPHHITFKTDDIVREIDRARQAGFEPVGVSIDNPWWKEAFVHPKQAGGTVVQIAQEGFDREQLETLAADYGEQYGAERWWPDVPPPPGEKTELRRVVVATEELGRALALYEDLLEGSTTDHGDGWVELRWPGGGRIRIEAAAGRAEGIDRLEWTHDGAPFERIVGGAKLVVYSEP